MEKAGFLEPFIVIVREGIEAIVVLGAISAYLVASNHAGKLKAVYAGAVAAIIASIATAFIFEAFFSSAEYNVEILEGGTLLVAAAVLLYTTNWFLSKMESGKWLEYIKGKAGKAIARGRNFSLGAVAFLAVYREGIETVLFMKALTLTNGISSEAVFGLAAVFAVLALLFFAILKIGARLPLKIVFGVSGALLFLLALKFAGAGIHELQEAKTLPETKLDFIPAVPLLGIFPTIESIGIQALALAAEGVFFFRHFRPNAKQPQ